jgi:hypothetical protein
VSTFLGEVQFTLTGDGSISFQNVSTGDCGYLHSTGSYVLVKSDGSIVADAPRANVSVSGMNIQASASQDVVVEAKGQASIKSCGKLDTSGTAIAFF